MTLPITLPFLLPIISNNRHDYLTNIESIDMSNESVPPRILEWLGFKRKPDFSKARTLGSFLGFFLSLVVVALLFAAIVTLSDFVRAGLRLGPYISDVDGSAIRNTGLVLAALLGAPFVVWRSVVAAKQARIADEALFNDKINAAAQDLAARKEVTQILEQEGIKSVLNEVEDDLVRRAAAIDRLEGLATEREGAAPRVVRLLATYVRGNFPCMNLGHTEPPFTRKTPRMDLQKAIDTIGRVHRHASEIDKSHWRLDLKGCDFDGVNFQGGFFWAADFSDCRLEACNLREANFEGCLFRGSLLNFSDFWRVNFTGAKLDRAILNRSGGILGSIGSGKLRGATFIAADITAVDLLGKPMSISETFGTKDTKVSGNVHVRMPAQTLHESAHLARDVRGDVEISEEERQQIADLEATGFQNWSPYNSGDLATGHLLEALYDKLGMRKWPYW